ncbi:unnamed protein product [Caenorhabditis angaria]|uniref:Domain of unknown function DX domain-containing protein n=1 Tax=Caenorhabditis angaria TaxID=860376 RepID=A0A9P1N0J8_9PELO|nr:unnamed protein product [Caenorhabditis angaria]
METTIFLIFLVVFAIDVHVQTACPDGFLDPDQEKDCTELRLDCKSHFNGTGTCEVVDQYGQLKCCPNKLHTDDFQTNTTCSEHQKRDDDFHSYCKNGYIFYFGRNNLKINNAYAKKCIVNSDCGEGNYCVVFMKSSIYKRRCYAIDPPKRIETEKKEKEKEKEKEDNTMLIIIIVVIVVIFVIVGIIAGFVVCKKMKKGKGGHKSSAENGKKGKSGHKSSAENTGHSEQKGKPSKEKMKKPKKGSKV